MILRLKKTQFEQDVLSPNGNIKFHFSIKSNKLHYEVYKNDKSVIKKSKLGFVICGDEPMFDSFTLVKEHRKSNKGKATMMWGEDKIINNNYNEVAFYLVQPKSPKRTMTLRVRVFDDAVAFRYEIPPQPHFSQLTIKEELTEFNLNPDSTVWKIPAYQPDRYEYNYEQILLGDLKGSAHTPFTARTPNGTYLSIHEAALYNYGSMTLKLSDAEKLKADITPLSDHTIAHVRLPFHTPWRLIMLADSAVDLTKNRTMFALNNPPEGDFKWVKTLKFIGIWWAMYVGEWTWAPGNKHGATTEHAKEYIDAAVRLGISGLLIEGWNDGWEGNWLENGMYNKFTVSTPDFDLEEVARYAKRRGVEIVGHHETVGFVDNYERQLKEAYDCYASNNIHYIKTGYSGSMMLIRGRREYHHSQLGVNHYQKTVELAAKKHICLDIHEPIKGTGIERTWPNLLSREGARGQEYEGGAISPSHACYLPYTRLLSGGMDYTSGIFDLANHAKPIFTTLARQLAYFVTIYSGMQMAADRPFIYEDKFKEEFEFIKVVPTNFEKTVPLAGEVGEYYVVARKDRDSGNWFIGGITNEKSRKVHLSLDFLNKTKYRAKSYMDTLESHYQKNQFAIKKETQNLTKNSSLDIYMAPGGGFAIWLKPE